MQNAGMLLVEQLSKIEAPRIETKNKRHRLVDILMIAFCSMLCGAEGWEDMELFGQSKESWFRQFLDFPHGIPSHDTFARVFRALNPSVFQEGLVQWLVAIQAVLGEPINIDGKTLGHSFDRAAKQSALHLVNAWASETKLILGQVAVESKENEMVAIPKLLQLLELRGSFVSLDAMGTQTEIARQIIEQGGDYLLALKPNHPLLFEEVTAFFSQCPHEEMQLLAQWEQEVEGGHGRVELRKCWVSRSLNWLEQRGQWKGLQTVICLESMRDLGETISMERRLYLTSLPPEPKVLLKAIRKHWGVENHLHWALDTNFYEDASRIRKDHAPENLSMLRKVALSWLYQQTSKRSVRSKKKKVAWNNRFLEKLLFG